MIKRAFFEMSASDADYVWKHLDRAETFVTNQQLEAERLQEVGGCEVLSTFIHSQLSDTTLRALSKLRMIATRSTGYDHVDLNYCRAHGITVCNVPVYGDNT